MKFETPPNRLEEVTGFAPADNGRAGVLLLDTADGPITLELDERGMRLMLMAVLQLSVACAERRVDIPDMGASDPQKSVYLPASDVQALPVTGSHRRLVIRTGVIDLSLLLRDEATTKGLIWALGG